MKVSEHGINLIKQFEGCRLTPYKDIVGIWTVGYGRVLTYGHDLPQHLNKSFKQGEVDELLRQDLQRFERGVSRLLPQLLQHEFDALVSFSFNLGLGTLQRSTVRQALIRGDKKQATDSWLRYCRAGGKVIRGLERRRIAEVSMFHRL